MRIRALLSILVLVLFVLLNGSVYAQPANIIQVPGLDCGNAHATDGTNACCQQVQTPQIPDGLMGTIITNIPGIGDFLTGILQLNRTTKPTPCVVGYPKPDANDPNCICVSSCDITPAPLTGVGELCDDYLVHNPSETVECRKCAEAGGMWTAIGCVHGDIGRFISHTLLGFGVSLAGIVSLGCLIYASIILQTSRGNAERIQKARDMIQSCLIGLILVIFSIFILRVIGVDILRIPGLGWY